MSACECVVFLYSMLTGNNKPWLLKSINFIFFLKWLLQPLIQLCLCKNALVMAVKISTVIRGLYGIQATVRMSSFNILLEAKTTWLQLLPLKSFVVANYNLSFQQVLNDLQDWLDFFYFCPETTDIICSPYNDLVRCVPSLDIIFCKALRNLFTVRLLLASSVT